MFSPHAALACMLHPRRARTEKLLRSKLQKTRDTHHSCWKYAFTREVRKRAHRASLLLEVCFYPRGAKEEHIEHHSSWKYPLPERCERRAHWASLLLEVCFYPRGAKEKHIEHHSFWKYAFTRGVRKKSTSSITPAGSMLLPERCERRAHRASLLLYLNPYFQCYSIKWRYKLEFLDTTCGPLPIFYFVERGGSCEILKGTKWLFNSCVWGRSHSRERLHVNRNYSISMSLRLNDDYSCVRTLITALAWVAFNSFSSAGVTIKENATQAVKNHFPQ